MRPIYAAVFAAFALSACATMFPDPPARSSYGDAPSGYESQMTRLIAASLKDPESATIEFDQPMPAYRTGKLGGIDWQGYLVTANVNAKNSYGGYTGNKEWWGLYSSGELFEFMPPDELGRARIRTVDGGKP